MIMMLVMFTKRKGCGTNERSVTTWVQTHLWGPGAVQVGSRGRGQMDPRTWAAC